jgi:hypothetical protein
MLVPQPCPFQVEIATAMLEKHEPLSSDQILTEIIQAGGEKLRSEIHKFVDFIWNKEGLPE